MLCFAKHLSSPYPRVTITKFIRKLNITPTSNTR